MFQGLWFSVRSTLTILISLVWLINGLFSKMLNLVPRHQLIVARILGEDHAEVITKVIGLLEILMCVWILSGIKSRLCTLIQIVIVLTMNIIEFIIVPDQLLFGKLNLLIAIAFTGILVIHEFILMKPSNTTA